MSGELLAQNNNITRFDGYGPSLVGSTVPQTPVDYPETLKRLVMYQDNGVTHFYGGPLHLEDDQRVWISPVEVDDGTKKSYFQVLYVNARPEDALEDNDKPVTVLDIDETSYKLAPTDHPGVQALREQFSTNRSHILVRRCTTGMAYYPEAVHPGQDQEVAGSHLNKLLETMGFQEPGKSLTLALPRLHEIGSVALDSLYDVEILRKYTFSGGEINLYGIVARNDPWKYYEVYTPGSLDDINGDNLLIRIDSGCDIGQIYDDKGCDCREQLHTALEGIQNEGTGLVLHIPSQDGRGFGMATKMETEGIKRGIRVATNFGQEVPMDTIDAARTLLGDNFDIRTYDGAGRILAALGVNSVILKTDNRRKFEGLASAGIQVRRRATQTKGANGSLHHVAAKHRHGAIYFGHEEEVVYASQ